jgi:phage internal scaffolding protein
VNAEKTLPFVRSPYNYDTTVASDETALHCKDPTLTKQSFAEDADINTIVKRFALTGELPKNVRMPTYGDFTGLTTFKEAMDAIAIAEESFYAMPADVRSRFNNDPDKFVAFCSDNNNRQEAEKLGLVLPPAPLPPRGPQDLPEPPKPLQDAPKAPQSDKN